MTARRRRNAMQQDQIPLSTLATAFQIFNKTTGKSPGTVAWYDLRLALYGRFAGPDASLGDITPARVREYIVELQERTQPIQVLGDTQAASQGKVRLKIQRILELVAKRRRESEEQRQSRRERGSMQSEYTRARS